MPISKADLKGLQRFHLANPLEIDGFEEWVLWLEAILHGPCSVIEVNGEAILVDSKQVVHRLEGLKIEIRSNEHPPPHFHVTSPEVNASFAIADGCQLNGSVSPSALKKIKHWHSHSKSQLIERWNAARPTECTVGNFRA